MYLRSQLYLKCVHGCSYIVRFIKVVWLCPTVSRQCLQYCNYLHGTRISHWYKYLTQRLSYVTVCINNQWKVVLHPLTPAGESCAVQRQQKTGPCACTFTRDVLALEFKVPQNFIFQTKFPLLRYHGFPGELLYLPKGLVLFPSLQYLDAKSHTTQSTKAEAQLGAMRYDVTASHHHPQGTKTTYLLLKDEFHCYHDKNSSDYINVSS